MACFDQLRPSSKLSPRRLAVNMDRESDASPLVPSSPHALLHQSSAATLGLGPTSCSSFKQAPSQTSSIGRRRRRSAEAAKVIISKRRRKSRAKPHPPIRQISANKLNFKDIVHQLTGALRPITSQPSIRHSPCSRQVPGVDHGAVYNLHQNMASTSAKTWPSQLVDGARLAQSLTSLHSMAAYILQSTFSESTPLQGTVTQSNTIRRDIGELENFLLKGDSKLDSFLALSCFLLNQIASNCRDVLSTGS